MNSLTDVDGFKICFQVCVWLGFPPLFLEVNQRQDMTHKPKADPGFATRSVVTGYPTGRHLLLIDSTRLACAAGSANP